MVSAKAIELIAHAIETSKDSYDKIAAATNISKATLSRLVQKHTASRYTLDVLAAYFEIGEKYQELVGSSDHTCAFAAELTEELRQTRAYYEAKAVSVRQHYEEQLTALREQNVRQEQERTREREQQQRSYDASVSYLKTEVERLRSDLDKARSDAASASKASGDIIGKKHTVFWVLVAIDVLMAIALIIALMTDSIL